LLPLNEGLRIDLRALIGWPTTKNSVPPTLSLRIAGLSGFPILIGRSETANEIYPMQPSMSRANMKLPAVLIADDHTLVGEGLASLVADKFDVISTVDSGTDLLKIAATRPPDLALIDVSMPDMTGLEAAEKLLEMLPSCKVIFVSMHSNPDFVREAFAAGAMGYVLKRAAGAELIEAMQEVLKGNAYISRQIASGVLAAFLHPRSAALTDRQRQVVRLVSEGRSAKEIAKSLNISVKTAQFHKSTIMQKLGIHSTAELTKYAIDHGIIS
jgi:DNA-binding NarL/FixJ family response regulator